MTSACSATYTNDRTSTADFGKIIFLNLVGLNITSPYKNVHSKHPDPAAPGAQHQQLLSRSTSTHTHPNPKNPRIQISNLNNIKNKKRLIG
jgi:hypothetical protein